MYETGDAHGPRASGESRCGLDMYGPERICSLLDVKADRVDDRKRISDGPRDRFLIVNVSPSCFQSVVGVVDNPIARLGMTSGYSRREIPTKQAVNDAAPEETGSTKDRNRSTCAQRVHQRSLTNTNTSARLPRRSHRLQGERIRNAIVKSRHFSRIYSRSD
jgi:hypothetical protein